jgi:endoribonuclease Dicer
LKNEKLEVSNEEDELELQSRSEYVFTVPKSGATATFHNSIRIVQNYCSTLPRDLYYFPSPEYFIAEGPQGFVCEIHMPAGVRPEIKTLRGSFQSNIRHAKFEVAFRMVKLLHSLGELDDHLRPLKLDAKTIGKFISKNKQTKNSKRKVRSHAVFVPSPFEGSWIPGVKVIVNAIRLKSSSTKFAVSKCLNVGFLSFDRLGILENERIFRLKREDQSISIIPFHQKLFLTEKNIALFRKFHYNFFISVLRSQFSEVDNFATFCIPFLADQISIFDGDIDIDPFEIIDWEALNFCAEVDINDLSVFQNGNAKFDDISEYIVYDEPRYKRNYIILELRPDLNPYSAIEDGPSNFANVAEIYQRRLNVVDNIEKDQFLLHAKPIGYPYHSISPTVSFQNVMIVPQFAQLCRIQKRHLREALKMPILLRYIFHRQLMADIINGDAFDIELDGGFNTNMDLLQKAFTCPAANVAYNYERLEFFGDSFLKVYLTLHLFVANPYRQEGYLSQSRTELENNIFLRQKASHLKLEGFILHNPFSRQHFIPPTVDSQPNQLISDKTVADVVEATIGACFLHAGEPAASSTVKLFIGDFCESSFALYHEKWISHQLEYPGLEPFAVASCKLIEEKIGYTFNNKAILSEAFNHASAITVGRSYERLEFLGK